MKQRVRAFTDRSIHLALFRVRSLVKSTLAHFGLSVQRVQSYAEARPIGVMSTFLEDLHTRGLRCETILDVGANRGDWTRLARSVFPEARYVMIEPQHEMARHLDALCKGDPKCRWFEAGAGAKSGELTLTVWEDLVGSSFLAPEPYDDGIRSQREERTVPVVTIDELLEREGYPAPELVKLDIQGFELEALRGAESIFGTTEVFILEVSLFQFMADQPVFADVVEFMDQRGYATYDLAGYMRRSLDGALGQVDLCFARRDGMLESSSSWA